MQKQSTLHVERMLCCKLQVATAAHFCSPQHKLVLRCCVVLCSTSCVALCCAVRKPNSFVRNKKKLPCARQRKLRSAVRSKFTHARTQQNCTLVRSFAVCACNLQQHNLCSEQLLCKKCSLFAQQQTQVEKPKNVKLILSCQNTHKTKQAS